MPSRGSRPRTPRSGIDPGYTYRGESRTKGPKYDLKDDGSGRESYGYLPDPGEPTSRDKLFACLDRGDLDDALAIINADSRPDDLIRFLLFKVSEIFDASDAVEARRSRLDQAEEGLKRKVSVLNSQTAERKNRLDALEQEHDGRKAKLDARQGDLDQLQQDLAGKEQDLAERELRLLPTEEVKRQQDAIDARAAELEIAESRAKDLVNSLTAGLADLDRLKRSSQSQLEGAERLRRVIDDQLTEVIQILGDSRWWNSRSEVAIDRLLAIKGGLADDH